MRLNKKKLIKETYMSNLPKINMKKAIKLFEIFYRGWLPMMYAKKTNCWLLDNCWIILSQLDTTLNCLGAEAQWETIFIACSHVCRELSWLPWLIWEHLAWRWAVLLPGFGACNCTIFNQACWVLSMHLCSCWSFLGMWPTASSSCYSDFFTMML